MEQLIKNLALIVLFAPLIGSVVVGLAHNYISRSSTHWITVILMFASWLASVFLFKLVVLEGQSYNGTIYNWATVGQFQFNMGFQIDSLTSIMMLIVTTISLLVHIYSIGYMKGDPGYQRFFSYVSFFTFAMLLLVSANNFLQLYFGWEGVGLASYLLIGFWYKKDSAANAGLKAFLVNRVGDFGFIIGIAGILGYFGSLDYHVVFGQASQVANTTMSIFPGTNVSVITVICVLLFIGAMGKSAQIPLHVWLPDSMEGPTPISALIHAATMVTAGVFMVARVSPLFELSETALSFVLVIGASGALFLGLLALVENDIKRIIAYSTLSQLGYMMAAVGVSAFSAGIFHLGTHAFFKALLFLAAGSVIIAMHHEQNILKMGNLKKYLPFTYVCFLIGALALAAVPPFSGFFSKEAVIAAVEHSPIPGSQYAYYCLLIGAFVTGFYIFRAFFLTFHTKEKFDPHMRSHIREHATLIIPIILLAIPSAVIGLLTVEPMLYQAMGWLGPSVVVLPHYNVMPELAHEFVSIKHCLQQSIYQLPVQFAIAGIILAWVNYMVFPSIPGFIQRRFQWLNYVLKEKYGFDNLYNLVFVRWARIAANFLFHVGDLKILDGLIVDGSGRDVIRISSLLRKMQSGYLYHYVFVMIVAVLAFLVWMFV